MRVENHNPLPLVVACHSISGVTKLLGRLYYYDPASGKPGSLPANVDASISAVALIGTLAGQVGLSIFSLPLGRDSIAQMTIWSAQKLSLPCGHERFQ